MTTTYLCYVRGGREFEVEQAIQEMGLGVYCARRMRFIRKGKKRRAEPEVSPYLGNYIFVDIPAERYLDVLAVKYLAGTTYALSGRDMRALGAFKDAVDTEYAEQDRKRRNQEAISEFTPGQALKMLDGQFSDNMLTFRSLVERPHDIYPKIKAEMELFGQTVSVEVDPLQVRAAE